MSGKKTQLRLSISLPLWLCQLYCLLTVTVDGHMYDVLVLKEDRISFLLLGSASLPFLPLGEDLQDTVA